MGDNNVATEARRQVLDGILCAEGAGLSVLGQEEGGDYAKTNHAVRACITTAGLADDVIGHRVCVYDSRDHNAGRHGELVIEDRHTNKWYKLENNCWKATEPRYAASGVEHTQ